MATTKQVAAAIEWGTPPNDRVYRPAEILPVAKCLRILGHPAVTGRRSHWALRRAPLLAGHLVANASLRSRELTSKHDRRHRVRVGGDILRRTAAEIRPSRSLRR